MDAVKFFLGAVLIICLLLAVFVLFMWLLFEVSVWAAMGLFVLVAAGAATYDEFSW